MFSSNTPSFLLVTKFCVGLAAQAVRSAMHRHALRSLNIRVAVFLDIRIIPFSMCRQIECSRPYPVLLYRLGFLCSISDAKLQGKQAKMQIGYTKRVYIQERGPIMTTHRPEPVCSLEFTHNQDFAVG